MRVTSVSYERTHNLGDFCSVKSRVEVTLDDGEDPDEAMAFCKQKVHESIRQEVQRKKKEG